MEGQILKVVGQVAGIGGIGLGIFLILFREVIRLKVFPRLGRREAYRVILLILILVWSVAIAGLTAWSWVQYQDRQKAESSHTPFPASKSVDDRYTASTGSSGEVDRQEKTKTFGLSHSQSMRSKKSVSMAPPKEAQTLQSLRVTGTGFASSEFPREQRKSLARRAAEVDARRRLAEMLETRIQSKTEVVDLGVKHDNVTATVDERVRNARVVSERELADDGYEVVLEAQPPSLD
ncbi:MAG TPA: hypothetical protein VH988_08560 [Thermoanaerobaculia bacterium]|jgi:hypothetical protein|nr:hypothetical protein [Thermoanaerobaculia bacterium]